VVLSKLLLAAPVLIALAIASTSPAPTAAVPPGAAAPSVAPQKPPAECPPGDAVDDDSRCTETLTWQECEPAWHQDLRRTHQPAARLGRRPAPGSLYGPI